MAEEIPPPTAPIRQIRTTVSLSPRVVRLIRRAAGGGSFSRALSDIVTQAEGRVPILKPEEPKK